MENKFFIDEDGTKHWYKDGILHREDGPAVEYTDGTKQWYRDGKLHREDGPAVEWVNGATDWYLEGVHLGYRYTGFWNLWDRLTDTQRANPNLLKYLPR